MKTNRNNYEKLPDVVGVIEEFHGRFELEQDREQILLRHVRSIKGQLYQPNPNDSVLKEHLSAIREILKDRGGNELADAAVAEIQDMIGSEDNAPSDNADDSGGKSAAAPAGKRRPGPGLILLAVVAGSAGIALAIAGGWLVHDGLLGGYMADNKQMMIGTGVLAGGVFVMMLGLRCLLRGRAARIALGALVLAGVAVFAVVSASRVEEIQQQTADDIMEAEERVQISGTDQYVFVPGRALRSPRWYESGIAVITETDAGHTEMTIPRKYVVTLDD